MYAQIVYPQIEWFQELWSDDLDVQERSPYSFFVSFIYFFYLLQRASFCLWLALARRRCTDEWIFSVRSMSQRRPGACWLRCHDLKGQEASRNKRRRHWPQVQLRLPWYVLVYECLLALLVSKSASNTMVYSFVRVLIGLADLKSNFEYHGMFWCTSAFQLFWSRSQFRTPRHLCALSVLIGVTGLEVTFDYHSIFFFYKCFSALLVTSWTLTTMASFSSTSAFQHYLSKAELRLPWYLCVLSVLFSDTGPEVKLDDHGIFFFNYCFLALLVTSLTSTTMASLCSFSAYRRTSWIRINIVFSSCECVIGPGDVELKIHDYAALLLRLCTLTLMLRPFPVTSVGRVDCEIFMVYLQMIRHVDLDNDGKISFMERKFVASDSDFSATISKDEWRLGDFPEAYGPFEGHAMCPAGSTAVSLLSSFDVIFRCMIALRHASLVRYMSHALICADRMNAVVCWLRCSDAWLTWGIHIRRDKCCMHWCVLTATHL